MEYLYYTCWSIDFAQALDEPDVARAVIMGMNLSKTHQLDVNCTMSLFNEIYWE
jgi:hypothetical protein